MQGGCRGRLPEAQDQRRRRRRRRRRPFPAGPSPRGAATIRVGLARRRRAPLPRPRRFIWGRAGVRPARTPVRGATGWGLAGRSPAVPPSLAAAPPPLLGAWLSRSAFSRADVRWPPTRAPPTGERRTRPRSIRRAIAGQAGRLQHRRTRPGRFLVELHDACDRLPRLLILLGPSPSAAQEARQGAAPGSCSVSSASGPTMRDGSDGCAGIGRTWLGTAPRWRTTS